MLKIACSFTGDNYKLLASDTPASKKKVIAMAIAMQVPVLIWVINGFMLSYKILEAGLGCALITALICGSIIFLIEKLIIMAKGNNSLTTFRICIGLVVAVLGSIAIDEVVFSDDIDLSVAGIKDQQVLAAKMEAANTYLSLNNMDSINKNIGIAQNKYDQAELTAVTEAEGSTGTHKFGLGKVAIYKDRKAQDRKSDLVELKNSYTKLTAGKDSAIELSRKKTESSFNEHGLLTRIKALFSLVSTDGYMATIYILFTLLMFFFEFLVVVLKLTWDKTNYERKLEMIEEIGMRRMEFLLKKESPASDPGQYLPQFEQTRDAVKKNYTMYN